MNGQSLKARLKSGALVFAGALLLSPLASAQVATGSGSTAAQGASTAATTNPAGSVTSTAGGLTSPSTTAGSLTSPSTPSVASPTSDSTMPNSTLHRKGSTAATTSPLSNAMNGNSSASGRTAFNANGSQGNSAFAVTRGRGRHLGAQENLSGKFQNRTYNEQGSASTQTTPPPMPAAGGTGAPGPSGG